MPRAPGASRAAADEQLQRWGLGGLVAYVLFGFALWPLVWSAAAAAVTWLCVRVALTYFADHPRFGRFADLAEQRVCDVELAVGVELAILLLLGAPWWAVVGRIAAEVSHHPFVHFTLCSTHGACGAVVMHTPADNSDVVCVPRTSKAATEDTPTSTSKAEPSPSSKHHRAGSVSASPGKAVADNVDNASLSRAAAAPSALATEHGVTLRVGKATVASGAMREVYRAVVTDVSQHVLNTPALSWLCPGAVVAVKKYKKELAALDMRGMLRDDLQMQAHAARYAAAFNARSPPPPKPVHFVPAAVLEVDGWDVLLWVEPYLAGVYKKHSSNSGYVRGDRLTPEAFSHSTYAATNGELVVVDLQGVGDQYTDPQIHTEVGLFNKILFFLPSDARNAYGMGNLKGAGIAAWRNSHECNAVCHHLKLPELRRDDGTSTTARLPRAKRDGASAAPPPSR